MTSSRLPEAALAGRPPARPSVATGFVPPRPKKTPFFTGPVVWMTLLLGALCFEGLGRVLVQQIPSLVFYVAKDLVLLASLFFLRIPADVWALARSLLGKWRVFLPLSMVWTVIEVFNPDQASIPLAILGLRSYWVWWFAPVLISAALRTANERNRATLVLAVFAIFIAFYASAQFTAPADSDINAYALYNGEVVMKTASVHETGRARVSGTFSYISGFGDFAVLASVTLLSFAIDVKGRSRVVMFAAAALAGGSGAMSGSRTVVIFVAVGLAIVLFRSGYFRLRGGRWAITALLLAGGFAYYQSSDAVQGVKARFELSDTADRIQATLTAFPPVAIATIPFPVFGIGTGMQQSARYQMDLATPYIYEEEPPRLLVELGLLGFLMFWFARLGLFLGLIRASRILKVAGKDGASGGAVALAVMAMFSRLVFDHVWQALFFTATGLILSATLEVVRAKAARHRVVVAPPRPAPAGSSPLTAAHPRPTPLAPWSR